MATFFFFIFGLGGLFFLFITFVPDDKDKRFKTGLKKNAQPTPFKFRLIFFVISLILFGIAAAIN